MPAIHVQVQPIPFREMTGTVLADRLFLLLVLINIGFYFLYMQFYLTIPLQIVALTGEAGAVSLAGLVMAATVILCQYPVNRRISRLDPFTGLSIGFVCLGLGLFVLGHAGSLPPFLVGLLLFALGNLIIQPLTFDLTARLARREMTATYFGFGFLSLAIGGGLSQGLGGFLLQLGTDIGYPDLLWWICSAIALLSLAAIRWLARLMHAHNRFHANA
jgi:DHA1 family multidrug resistance protein-like MFS transporter